MAIERNLSVAKNEQFLYILDWIGEDFSSSDFVIELRPSDGETGTPLVSIVGAAAGVEGVSATYNPAYSIEFPAGSIIEAGASTITLQIDQATLNALDYAPDAEDNVVLRYDLVTGDGPRRLMFGDFIIYAGTSRGAPA